MMVRHNSQGVRIYGRVKVLYYEETSRKRKIISSLKEVDEEYRTTLINFVKYKIVMFTMAKIMKMEQDKRNKVTLYLFNIVKYRQHT